MEHVDVAIVGGGPAGLNAALCLGRARKTVAVFDAGNPRHAVAEGVHNFLTREGMPPAELRRVAWEQMRAYPSVRLVAQRIGEATREEGAWVLTDERGEATAARALLIATGVVDEHPDIPGYAERWGHSIHQCPYCHGWEVREQPVAVLGANDQAMHLAPLLRGWSDDVVVLTNGVALDEERRGSLAARGIAVHEQAVVSLHGEGRALDHVLFADGSRLSRRALFAATEQRQVPLVAQLGLALNEFGYVIVDAMLRTSREGAWAAGDVTSRMQQVVEAAAQGMRAGAIINATLTMGM